MLRKKQNELRPALDNRNCKKCEHSERISGHLICFEAFGCELNLGFGEHTCDKWKRVKDKAYA